jgi:hypothetical protein
MRLKPLVCLFAIFALLAVPAAVFAKEKKVEDPQPLRELTGIEWMELSIGQRHDHLAWSMFVLGKKGIVFAKTPNEYYHAVYKRLRADMSNYEVGITTILAEYVGETENQFPRPAAAAPAPRKARPPIRTS